MRPCSGGRTSRREAHSQHDTQQEHHNKEHNTAHQHNATQHNAAQRTASSNTAGTTHELRPTPAATAAACGALSRR